MPVGRERARRARDKLQHRLRATPWIRSVSLAKGPYGYCIALTVDAEHPDVHRVPMHIDGVEVIARPTKAQRAAKASKPHVGAESFGDAPISTIEPGGPIYKTPDGITMLSPGRYTYSNPVTTYDAGIVLDLATPIPGSDYFEQWLKVYGNFVKVTKRVPEKYSTVTSEFYEWVTGKELPTGATPYYIDYEFEVLEPVVWNLKGLPTWLPSDLPIEDYWGKGFRATPVGEVLDKARDALPSLPDVTGFLWAAAAVGAMILISRSQKRSYA